MYEEEAGRRERGRRQIFLKENLSSRSESNLKSLLSGRKFILISGGFFHACFASQPRSVGRPLRPHFEPLEMLWPGGKKKKISLILSDESGEKKRLHHFLEAVDVASAFGPRPLEDILSSHSQVSRLLRGCENRGGKPLDANVDGIQRPRNFHQKRQNKRQRKSILKYGQLLRPQEMQNSNLSRASGKSGDFSACFLIVLSTFCSNFFSQGWKYIES